MSTKKTIQINPELFKLSGNKTKKNKERKELTLQPIVTPNNLKNKLLKRIKEHKTNELKQKPTPKPNLTNNDNSTYTDEFNGALNYLSDLTKKQKVVEAKHRAINMKTLKNPNSYLNTPQVSQGVSLELPPELQETNSIVPQSNEVFNVNYKVLDDVPYGCLKNGKKKTYREWKELEKPSLMPDLPDIVRPPTPPKKNVGIFLSGLKENPEKNENLNNQDNALSRQERLEQIKNKLRKIQDEETNAKKDTLEAFNKLEKQLSAPLLEPLGELTDTITNNKPTVEEMLQERELNNKKNEKKKYLKKTVKRKFTLGKSDKLRRVSVLIKDRQTRKNIINTQKELKKTNITDVRKYLRQHGIIKVGSTCPADILRKTFECAVLTGEVNNTNKDTLLHNFLSSEKDV